MKTEDAVCLGLRIGAIFIIFIVSVAGVASPVVLYKIPWCRKRTSFFAVAQTFGGGVIMGTAVIHILPDAQETLTAAWPDIEYPVAAAFTLGAICFTLLVEQLAASYFEWRHKQSHHSCEAGGKCKNEEDATTTATKEEARPTSLPA
eukprot:TRINITY_DN11455_c0_g1_i3.p1 TRINITY_DN11455_c0_g1~~TRINITY_DN11455_c0_g1_i3.p1  ORF type:complete len:155 (-),score=38.31 TRINITY_DN11455_c0_g1_i3:935-1375(-)